MCLLKLQKSLKVVSAFAVVKFDGINFYSLAVGVETAKLKSANILH